mmetsp:Transcript_38457/g.28299  ORF Transcript_38457/g.28299 Transcript_38457/m.28299 type:complete len:85 (+) Transcript_38457:916-1170(+)
MSDHNGVVKVGNANAHVDKVLTPTVILNPSLDSPLMQDEIFGPILPVITYKTLDDAIAVINQQPKPLVVYFCGKVTSANRHKVE